MEDDILQLEKKYWAAMESRDYETVKSLTRFPCIIAGEHGVQSVGEAEFKNMFDSGEGRALKVLAISNVVTQVLNDTALMAYHIQLSYAVDGQESSGNCACASTWLRENGRWVCSLHTESKMK